MNLIDAITLIVLICFALKGLVRGLVNEASSLAGLILGGWAAYVYYPDLAILIQGWLHLSKLISSFLAFMLLLFLIGFIAHIIGNIVTAALRVVMLGALNRLGGVLIGAAEGALILSLLFSVGSSEFMPVQLKTRIRESSTASMFAGLGGQILQLWRTRDSGKQ
jgi:membrane protein required for colicin V production